MTKSTFLSNQELDEVIETETFRTLEFSDLQTLSLKGLVAVDQTLEHMRQPSDPDHTATT
jgi:hypothetical protein